MKILVVSDGRRGIENQALGLAEAVARQTGATGDIAVHTIANRASFAALPPSLQGLARRKINFPDADLVIGCGRQAIAPLMAQRRSNPDSFTVYVQDPRLDASHFDLVVAPEHDGLSGPNVETMIGSPNRIVRDTIIGATLSNAAQLGQFPMPRAMIAIGGPSKTHTMDGPTVQSHLDAAKGLIDKGYSLLITTSRRTPDAARKAWRSLAAVHNKSVWLHTPDSPGDNPYFAFLGGADMILVTEDSTNMLTEACATGKAVFRLPMEAKANKADKFQTLYDVLETRCHVTRWNDNAVAQPYFALDETSRVAHIILSRMAAR